MAKKKKIKKTIKNKTKKIKEPEIIEEKTESEVEEKLKETEDEIQDRKFTKFTISSKSTAPVLEKIATAPEIETQSWEINTQEPEREKEKSKSEYEVLEKTLEEYEPVRAQDTTSAILIRHPESIDIQSIGRQRQIIGREFQIMQPEELRTESKDYKTITPEKQGFEQPRTLKEEVGREYKVRKRKS